MTARKNETKKTEKKQAAPSMPSTINNPVQFVRETCEKMKGAKRREVIAALVARGVNKWTASTQYQLWRSPKSKKAAAE